jgi:hypothetical protein
MEDRVPQARARKSNREDRQAAKQQQSSLIYSFQDNNYANNSRQEKLMSASHDDFASPDANSLFQVIRRPGTASRSMNESFSNHRQPGGTGNSDQTADLDGSLNYARSRRNNEPREDDSPAPTAIPSKTKKYNRRARDADLITDDLDQTITSNAPHFDINDESDSTAKRPPVTPRRRNNNNASRNNDSMMMSNDYNGDSNENNGGAEPRRSEYPPARSATLSREHKHTTRSTDLNRSGGPLSNRSLQLDEPASNYTGGGGSARSGGAGTACSYSSTSVTTHGQKIILTGIFTFDGRSVDLELFQNFIRWKSISGKKRQTGPQIFLYHIKKLL